MTIKICSTVFFCLIAVSLAACGCHRAKPAVAQAPPPRVQPQPPPPPMVQAPPPVRQVPVPESVFFTTDNSDITPQAAVTLKNQAEWLKQNPEARMEISGNADRRGSTEYNEKLAQQRADAVKEQLTDLGVSPDRLTTTSYGKDKPVCAEATATCEAANRRVDLNVTMG